jgi:hypothetical protein
VIGWTPIVISVLLAPVGPPLAEPLEVAAVDGSAFPRVVVDIVAPVRYTAELVTAPMVTVDGAAIESVTPIDPKDVVIGLAIDDRPELSPAAVTELQGAAVELVRNSTDGVRVSLGTPSGLRTALTPDRDANIARLAGITAGSPAVVDLPNVLVDTVAELASSPTADRHAVVVLGAPVVADDAQLAALAAALTESGTRLHVVAPSSVEPAPFDRIARASGGEVTASPEVLASVDTVTARISNRYRVVANVAEPGQHRVRVSVGGEQFAASFEVPDPSGGSLPGTTAPPATAEPAEPNVPVETIAERTERESPRSRPRPADGGGLPTWPILYGVLAVAALALVWAGLAVVRRRGDDDDEVVVRAPADLVKQPPRPPAAPVPQRRIPAPAPPRTTERAAGPAGPAMRPEAPRPARTLGPAPQPAKDRSPVAHTGAPDWLVAGDLRMSRTRGEVWCGERKVDLTPSELGVLALLMTAGAEGVTRAAIVQAGELADSGQPDPVDAIVGTLRRKAGIRPSAGAVLRKRRVVRYILEEPVTEPGA